MLSVDNLTFAHGPDPLFAGVSFVVGKNHKVAVVGPNGAGKSSLFRVISGMENPTQGKINVLGSVAMVPQEVKSDPDLGKSNTVIDYVNPEGEVDKHEIKRLFSGLGIDDIELEANPQNLSGGQKTKLALARALIAEPDLLILDEPTNFMDTKGKKWFMHFLSEYPKALMMVSHDVEMIDSDINKVLVINPQTRQIEEYKGTYTDALRLKREHDELVERRRKMRVKKIAKMEKSLTKLARFTSKKGVKKKTLQRHKVEKAKQELPDVPQALRKVRIDFPNPGRVGELPVRLFAVSKSYEENTVVSDLDLSVKRGERLFLLGPNGSGKSTLIKLIVGKTKPDKGMVRVLEGVRIGYYSQGFETLDLAKGVMETAEDLCDLSEGRTRSILGSFLFDHIKVKQKVESLSGGEKTRFSIALLILAKANVLLLDEPTTYLDVLSQRIILEALKDYKGTLIFTSHSEQFVEELEPDRVILMPAQKLQYWDDNLLGSVSEI